jgi:SSS family solute:Na+ symporter
MAGVMFGILTVEAQGIGIIFASLTDWDIASGAIVGGVIGILYVILAGMKEIGWVNLVNATVMYIGLILATVFVAFKLPGGNFDSVANFYTQQDQGFMLSIFGNTQIIQTFVLGTIVAVVFSQGTNQMLMQVAMAAESEKVIRKALWIAAPVNGLFGVFAVSLGLAAKSVPEFQAMGQKVAATSMLVSYLPPWLAALLLASFLAAILSTFAILALAIATIFANDIFKPLYKPDATEAMQTRTIRLTIVVVAGIAIGVAAFLPPILAAMNWLFAWLVPVFWVVVFGLFWKRHQGVAITALLVSWTLNSLWSFTELSTAVGLPNAPNAYVTLVVTLAILIPGNFLVSAPPGILRLKITEPPATTGA